MDDIAGMSDDELQMLQEVLHSTRMGVLYSTRMGVLYQYSHGGLSRRTDTRR